MDGDLLLEADDSVLEELGVSNAVERLKIKVYMRVMGCSHNSYQEEMMRCIGILSPHLMPCVFPGVVPTQSRGW